MWVDVVPSIGSEVRLRTLAGSRKICRYCRSSLISWICTIAAAVEIVVLSIDNVYRTSEGSCRGVRRTQCEHFAEGIGLFIGDLNGENCFDINNDTQNQVKRYDKAYSSGQSQGSDRRQIESPVEKGLVCGNRLPDP